MMFLKSVLVIGLALLAGSCARIDEAMRPKSLTAQEVAKLDGAYRGPVRYARGAPHCVRDMEMALTVTAGRVAGEVKWADAATRAPTAFDGYVDLEGQMITTMRAFGDVYVVRGTFLPDSFQASIVPEIEYAPDPRFQGFRFGTDTSCAWRAVLRRA